MPASALSSLGRVAKADLGDFGGGSHHPKNASRAAHSFVNKWGLAWKVPFSEFTYIDNNNQEYIISYISPISFAKYLLEKGPELLMGGIQNLEEGRNHLQSFWDSYSSFHPSHRLFTESHPTRSWTNTIPICFHGDEGRGKKKGNTVVLMFESCLGVTTQANVRKRYRYDHCSDCTLREPTAKRFKGHVGTLDQSDFQQVASPCAFQSHNTKENSFLTKYVLSVLPHDLYKSGNALEVVIDKICCDFRELFENGISVGSNVWYFGMTGLKGDLKWYEKIANLERCFNKQIGSGLQMCHECEAGSEDIPFEDASHFPTWGSTLFQSRPWSVTPSIVKIPFEAEDGCPERVLRRDLFHNTKVGILRNFVGSTVLFLISLGYFHDRAPGSSNARDVCLNRAYHHFFMYLKATKCKAGLRSFTPVFFNAKKQTDYGWINAKGSDVTLLVKWLVVVAGTFAYDLLEPEHAEILKRIHKAALCVRTWQRILYGHGLWLHRHCAMVVYQEMHEFLQHYNALAYASLSQYHFTGYSMTSKFHMLAHTKHELGLQLDQNIKLIASPLLYAAEMNEDVIGKLSRLSRRVDSRRATKRTVQIYLCKCKVVHRRFLLKSSGRPKKWLNLCINSFPYNVENSINIELGCVFANIGPPSWPDHWVMQCRHFG